MLSISFFIKAFCVFIVALSVLCFLSLIKDDDFDNLGG